MVPGRPLDLHDDPQGSCLYTGVEYVRGASWRHEMKLPLTRSYGNA